MSLPAPKEQVLTKMQELDAALQTAIKVRTELWSMVANLPDKDKSGDVEIPLTFYDSGHIIAWGNDSEHFRPSTYRLIQQLYFAPDRTLSKEDVRESVNEDEEASDEAVWTCLKRARQELAAVEFPYEIETLRSKGHRLTKISGT